MKLQFHQKYLLLILAMIVLPFQVSLAQIPERPSPPRLVNDLAGEFSETQRAALERKLVAFNDTTSNQITVVTIEDLGDYAISDFAFALGEQWKVGQKEFDNGVVIVFKPKRGNKRGQVFIAPGYGLEGAIPDITAKLIVENEMIPSFKQGDIYGGIDRSVDVIMSLASREYSFEQYGKKAEESPIPFVVIIIMIILFIIMMRSGRQHSHSVGDPLPWWIAMTMANSGRRSSSGDWGSFTGGSGGFGGGGGFGGFGGGSFGGGGAGGSW